jgi:hypothetical protein
VNIETFSSPRSAGYATVHKGSEETDAADDQRIDHLMVVAGPSCVGKSTFVKRLERGDYPWLIRKIDVGDLSDWTTVYSKDAADLDISRYQKVVLHYALPIIPLSRKTFGGYEHDHRLDIVELADRVTILSLFADRKTVYKRIRNRLRRVLLNCFRRPLAVAPRREFLRLLALKNTVNEPNFPYFSILYSWIDFCETMAPRNHLLIDYNHEPELVSTQQCRRRLEAYRE